MTAGTPHWDPDEIDRRFDDIVAGMQWQGEQTERRDGSAQDADEPVQDVPTDPWSTAPQVELDEAQQRRRAHAERRAERKQRREQDVADLAAENARRAAEYEQDDEHFVPPEPPPLPRPRTRTVLAALMMVLAVVLMIGPNVLNVSANTVLVLAIAMFVAGGALLVDGMRSRRSDDEADGWDDGSRL